MPIKLDTNTVPCCQDPSVCPNPHLHIFLPSSSSMYPMFPSNMKSLGVEGGRGRRKSLTVTRTNMSPCFPHFHLYFPPWECLLSFFIIFAYGNYPSFRFQFKCYFKKFFLILILTDVIFP